MTRGPRPSGDSTNADTRKSPTPCILDRRFERRPAIPTRRALLRVATATTAAALTACATSQDQAAWDGRRGYDGNGDYGYDPDAPREARAFAAQARTFYPAPGPPDDPWGPYIRQAATRFAIPEPWIRAVMRQESGGRTEAADGSPITSSAGAMGLMQVMPGTYDLMRRRYALGPDAFDPRNNILAGTAYLKEMHARFGAPAFLAAYNAGPDRVDAYLSGATMLPDETVNYVASIGPRIGMPAELPGAAAFAAKPPDPNDAAFAGGGMTGDEYAALRH